MTAYTTHDSYPVVIVGAGPVGLMLGCYLTRLGLDCKIIERETVPLDHSRSIGVHPTSLELLEELGLARKLIRRGVPVKKIQTYINGTRSGCLDLSRSAPPYNYILSTPQNRTEEVLEEHLLQLNPDVLTRGAEVLNIAPYSDGARLTVRGPDASEQVLRARFVVGCDGKKSLVRCTAGIPFDGGAYPDTFIMADYEENTWLEDTSAVFLHRQGTVESFPLPDNRRRWVVTTGSYQRHVTREMIEQRVAARTGHRLWRCANHMLGSFGVQRHLARTFARGPLLLAGDAAHVCSPSIGQGMNLGLQDARMLAHSLLEAQRAGRRTRSAIFNRYCRTRQRAARRASGRAQFYMTLCRRQRLPGLRNRVVRLMINSPLHAAMVPMFTMRRLESRIL
jgi:2-polyprenyl-6-methoxyphenol hydroxylase-like FAD-dependent oxidoreductase